MGSPKTEQNGAHEYKQFLNFCGLFIEQIIQEVYSVSVRVNCQTRDITYVYIGKHSATFKRN